MFAFAGHQVKRRCCCCAGLQWDYVFDWTVLKYQQAQISRPPLDTNQVQAGVATAAGIPPARRTPTQEEQERERGAASQSVQAQPGYRSTDGSKGVPRRWAFPSGFPCQGITDITIPACQWQCLTLH